MLALLCSSLLAAGFSAQPNIVLLTVDTLRADRLGCYGYSFPTSPNLDALAAQSLVFEDCLAEIPLTAPSFAAMLSSLFPRLTGLTRNGMRVRADVPLVQEYFQQAGYFTFAVQSNWTIKNRISGLGRGFSLYEDDFHKGRWGFIKSERYADEVTDVALDILTRRDPQRPFFAWIHYSDPHAPYHWHRNHNPSGATRWGLPTKKRDNTRYDSEVAFTDFHIGRLLEALPKDTIVVFTADHGESLHEHNYLGHGRRVYQTNIHVPLMIRAPGLAPGRTAAPARGIDIAPTLLGLAAISRPTHMLGVDLLKETPPQDRVRILETYGGAVFKLPGLKQKMQTAGPIRQTVVTEGWKLILGAAEPELFYLPEDPYEERNLFSEQQERYKTLRALINEWNAQHPRKPTKSDPLTSEDRRVLESLGYVD
jgi:arylsulfatase A-like enzyme